MDAVGVWVEVYACPLSLTLVASVTSQSVCFFHSITLTKYMQFVSIRALIVPAMLLVIWLYVSIHK